MHKLINIAVVGAGLVAVRHLEALEAITTARLVGIHSRTHSKAARLAKRHHTQAFQAIDVLLDEPSIDAVLVLTSTGSHFEIAAACLDAGKHVLVEKPVAETLDQIAALRDKAHEHNRLCMPSHNYIYAPEARRLYTHLKAGRLGRLASLWVLYNQVHPAEMGAADMMMRELMIHHAYTALRFAGRPTSIQATAGNLHFDDPEAHDQILLSAQIPDGALINLWGSFAVDDVCRDPWTMTIKAMGTEGTGTVSWDQICFGDEPHPGWDDAAYWDSFYYVQRHFIDACLNSDTQPLSSLTDALDAHIILNAARHALETGRRVEITYPS